jgi:hypothetical protein
MKIWQLTIFGDDKIYKTEKGFLEAINAYGDFINKNKVKYRIFESIEEGNIDNFLKERERDFKLKCVLGEIDIKEIKLKDNIKKLSFMINNIFKELPTEYKLKNRQLGWAVGCLNKSLNNTNDFIRELKRRKDLILSLSNDIIFIKAVLSVHNFRNLSYGLDLDDSYYENFKQAKKEIRNNI